MPAVSAGLKDVPSPANLAREGLPFWILWLLLCVILLLIALLFLREKDLRRRLNFFLSGPKRRMTRTQFRLRLSRAKRKKEDQLRRLGRTAWDGKIPLEKADGILRDIEESDERTEAARTALQQALDDVRRIDQTGGVSGPATKKPHRPAKAFKETGKNVRTARAGLERVEAERGRLFLRLGEAVGRDRPAVPDFHPIYERIDALNGMILDLMDRLDRAD